MKLSLTMLVWKCYYIFLFSSLFMKDLKEKFPDLRFGYFNPPKESYRSSVSA